MISLCAGEDTQGAAGIPVTIPPPLVDSEKEDLDGGAIEVDEDKSSSEDWASSSEREEEADEQGRVFHVIITHTHAHKDEHTHLQRQAHTNNKLTHV